MKRRTKLGMIRTNFVKRSTVLDKVGTKRDAICCKQVPLSTNFELRFTNRDLSFGNSQIYRTKKQEFPTLFDQNWAIFDTFLTHLASFFGPF